MLIILVISSPLVLRTRDRESDLFCLPLFLSHSSPLLSVALQRRSFSFGIPLFHAEVWQGREQVRATESLAAGWMGSDSIECVSSIDGMDEEDTARTQSSKPHGGAAPPAGIAPSTSVHELLECPVCANSMYPPIHQVDSFPLFQFDILMILRPCGLFWHLIYKVWFGYGYFRWGNWGKCGNLMCFWFVISQNFRHLGDTICNYIIKLIIRARTSQNYTFLRRWIVRWYVFVEHFNNLTLGSLGCRGIMIF